MFHRSVDDGEVRRKEVEKMQRLVDIMELRSKVDGLTCIRFNFREENTCTFANTSYKHILFSTSSQQHVHYVLPNR